MMVWMLASALAAEVKVLEDGAIAQPPGVVYFVPKKSAESFKVGLVQGTDRSQAGGITVIEKLYDDLCATPCAVELPAGWHEVLLQDKKTGLEWARRIEVKPGEQSYRIERYRMGYYWGLMLTSMIVTAPAGIPLWLANDGTLKRFEGRYTPKR